MEILPETVPHSWFLQTVSSYISRTKLELIEHPFRELKGAFPGIFEQLTGWEWGVRQCSVLWHTRRRSRCFPTEETSEIFTFFFLLPIDDFSSCSVTYQVQDEKRGKCAVGLDGVRRHRGSGHSGCIFGLESDGGTVLSPQQQLHHQTWILLCNLTKQKQIHVAVHAIDDCVPQ